MNAGRRLPRFALLIAPMLLFAVLRLPALIHQPGMQDEQWFAVPGLTVWQEGIPRIPYVPTRNRDTLFENADVCLMALPPGLFYTQAPFFAFFPAGYATARIPLFLAALATLGVTFVIVKRLGGSDGTAAAAATLASVSRPLLFTGLTTRPDLLSALAGWLSIIAIWQVFRSPRPKRFAFVAGALSGLAGLFHPFALVFAIQGGVALLCGATSVAEKAKRLAIYVLGNLVVISLWIPLIARYPYEFRSQFFANVLDRAGPGLPQRLIWPFPSLSHHARLLYEFAGPLQCVLLAIGLTIGCWMFWKDAMLPSRERFGILALAGSSVFLTATVAGLHPTKGYWVYPSIWIIAIACTGVQAFATRVRSGQEERLRRLIPTVSFALAMLMMLPGSGLRTTWIYLKHWQDPEYFAPAFIASVLEDLPKEGVFYADLSYVFDIYLSGRETRLCQEKQQYWGEGPLEYTYLILSWEGEDAGWAQQYEGQLVRRVGSDQIPQQCFVDLYRHADPGPERATTP